MYALEAYVAKGQTVSQIEAIYSPEVNSDTGIYGTGPHLFPIALVWKQTGMDAR